MSIQQPVNEYRNNNNNMSNSNSNNLVNGVVNFDDPPGGKIQQQLQQHQQMQSQQQQQQQQQVRPSGPADLSRLSNTELVNRVKKLEMDLLKLASDHNMMIREANHRIQGQSTEIINLKSGIARLEEDNAELRDLCCFLDDDRQKGRKLAREWQRFGRYTASVMRQEVAAYQSKLKDLDSKQQQLVSDNMELKELCLYLDEERNQNTSCGQCGASFRRDDGDGSSSGTNPTEEYNASVDSSTVSNHHSNNGIGVGRRISSTLDSLQQGNISSQILAINDNIRGVLSSQIVDYVRRLENRVAELEKEETPDTTDSITRRLQTLQVLQVCQGLDIDHEIGDQEKDLVRSFAKVVWKKLEDNPKV